LEFEGSISCRRTVGAHQASSQWLDFRGHKAAGASNSLLMSSDCSYTSTLPEIPPPRVLVPWCKGQEPFYLYLQLGPRSLAFIPSVFFFCLTFVSFIPIPLVTVINLHPTHTTL